MNVPWLLRRSNDTFGEEDTKTWPWGQKTCPLPQTQECLLFSSYWALMMRWALALITQIPNHPHRHLNDGETQAHRGLVTYTQDVAETKKFKIQAPTVWRLNCHIDFGIGLKITIRLKNACWNFYWNSFKYIYIYISSEKINLLKIFSLPIHVCGISHFFECPSLSLINVL